MEIMEDGNLVDRVRILLQRDMQYYQVLINQPYYVVCDEINRIKGPSIFAQYFSGVFDDRLC